MQQIHQGQLHIFRRLCLGGLLNYKEVEEAGRNLRRQTMQSRWGSNCCRGLLLLLLLLLLNCCCLSQSRRVHWVHGGGQGNRSGHGRDSHATRDGSIAGRSSGGITRKNHISLVWVGQSSGYGQRVSGPPGGQGSRGSCGGLLADSGGRDCGYSARLRWGCRSWRNSKQAGRRVGRMSEINVSSQQVWNVWWW